VLAALLLRAGQVVMRDELIDALWGPDSPATAVNVMHSYVAGLRKILEPGRARRDPGRLLALAGQGYVLRLADGQLDLHIAAEHLAHARQAHSAGDLPAVAAALKAALVLWQGTPLAGVPGPLAETERTRLAGWRLDILEDLAHTRLSLGRAVGLADELSALVAEHPFRERLAGLLMQALHQAGHQAEALTVYTHTRMLLVEELGIDPGPELQQLHLRILAGDPVLAANGVLRKTFRASSLPSEMMRAAIE
jgi:DNA-binding SARP family transcriptional activator